MKRGVLMTGILFGELGVVIGAFGAHALKAILLEHGRVETFELAVRYQLFHALFLMIAAIVPVGNMKQVGLVAYLVAGGTIIFSGSLYALSITGVTWWGAVTPIGGILLIAGWATMFWAVLGARKN